MAANGNGNGEDRAEKILTWAREHGNEFRGGDAAEFLGVRPTAVGPTLRAMVNAGTLTPTRKEGKTIYTVAPEDEFDVAELQRSDFEPTLRQSIADRLTALNEEIASIDARKKLAEAEAGKLRNAITVLSK